MRIPRLCPSAALSLTQSFLTDTDDQRTTIQRTSRISFSIASANRSPAGMFRSHHTDQPWTSKALAIAAARARSSLA